MKEYKVYMTGWIENVVYTITAKNESDAINKAYKLADSPFASLIKIELKETTK